MRIDRVVLDSNVIISAALNPSGVPGTVVRALRSGDGVLLFSQRTFEELRTSILRPKFDRYVSRDERMTFIADLAAIATWVSITGTPLGCRDPDDDKVLETALNGAADCLVTGDKDLLEMSPFRGIPILKPREFLRICNPTYGT